MATNLPIGGTGATGPVPVDTVVQGDGSVREIITLGGIGKTGTETQLTAGQKTAAASIPVVLASDQPPVRNTPRAGLVSVVAVGGTAVTVATGPINGGFITNPPNDDAQGVTAENLYVDVVGVPGSTDAAANGTTSLLFPGDSYPLKALPSGVNVMINAATGGHKVTVVIE